MAKSKHRRKGERRLPRFLRAGGRTATLSRQFREQQPVPGTYLPSEQELQDALGAIPDDMSWTWAKPRLTPLFERPDPGLIEGDPTINSVTSLGVAIGYGIEVGPTFIRVTKSMAQRWEATTGQIDAAAFDHLHDVIASLQPSDLQHAVAHGYMTRCLPRPDGWASSAILAGAEAVMRIFGSHDQVLTVPTRHMLLSFDETVPVHALVELTTGLEALDPHPLQLDPFFLHDGQLLWGGLAGHEEEEATV